VPVSAYIALGSNVGDRRTHLRRAVQSMPDLVAASHVYETDPVGGPAGQRPYLNMVVALNTDLTPRELLELCERLETAAGRVRAERWGPRTLDADVLMVGEEVVDEPDLVVPHPRLWERAFVVVPLADVAPSLTEHAHGLDTAGVRRVEDLGTGRG